MEQMREEESGDLRSMSFTKSWKKNCCMQRVREARNRIGRVEKMELVCEMEPSTLHHMLNQLHLSISCTLHVVYTNPRFS